MKVHLVNVSKRFGEQTLFAHLNLRFPEKGLVAVVGPSGCGKSTLLKIIAGLDRDFEGEVTLGNHSIAGSTIEENERFRLGHIGFVFQDFNLLNLDRVEANVMLPYLPFHQKSTSLQKRHLAEVLRSVGLAGFEKRFVQTLSGGEKQRVAIARALIHDPDLILADEPTGALDQAHAQKILEILRKISQKILVIVVSHDENLVGQFADQIVRFEQTDMIVTQNPKSSDKTTSFFFSRYPKNASSRGIPWTWSIAHARAHLKQKKWRTAISQMALGMSLLGVGLSLSLSQTISVRIEQTLTSMLGDPSIIMTPSKGSHVTPEASGAPLSEVEHLKEQFPEAIQGVGVTYENNFEDMFRDANHVVISSRGTKNPLPSFTLRDFNDFTWLSEVTESILPFRPPKMEKDEIVLGLTYADLTVLTGDLHIKNTLSALSQYVERQEIFLSLEVANLSWGYEDEQIFSLIGFFLTDQPHIIHADPLWNQWLLEEAMRFPITDNVSVLPELPWILRRVPFVHTRNDPSVLLDEALTNERFQAFVLDRFFSSEHPSVCGQGPVCAAPRLKVYLVEKNTIDLGDVDFVRKIAPFLGHYVACSPRGYAMYPSAFMAGFSRPTYFCSSDALLDQVIDSVSVISATEQATLLALHKGVLSGHFLSTGEDSVKLHSLPQTTLVGRLPREKHEIAISERMAREFYKSNKEAVGKTLFVGSSLDEFRDENATLRQRFGKASLTITGIVEGATSFIVQDDHWAITFFRDFLGVSSLDLLATSVAFSLNQKIDPSDLERLNRQFPTYSFQDPSYELSESLGETTRYISWVLVCLSCLGLLISALLLSLVLTLFMVENKKENELLETLGFEGHQRRRVAMTTLWVLDAQTWLLSCGELFVLNIGMGLYLDDIFNISGNLSVLPWPYLAMGGMTFILTLVVGSFVTSSSQKHPRLKKKTAPF